MNKYDLELSLIGCILDKPKLINELYIDLKCISDDKNRKMINFLTKCYIQDNTLDLLVLTNKFQDDKSKQEFLDYCLEIQSVMYSVSQFDKYQDLLQEEYRKKEINETIENYSNGRINQEELTSKIVDISNENLYLKQKSNKVTPEQMINTIRKVDNQIFFERFKSFNERLFIKQNTINIIGARPSEGKSALALNMFCDLAKRYKCLYFNMEMTESEVYERMIGIESGMNLIDVKKPITDEQEQLALESAKRLYKLKYEIINGSKSIQSIKSKIIREQRNEHLIVFIDYVGYITSRQGLSDRDRIGEITRELNNLTKDYNCTVFLIAQINRNGSDMPTMNDLKDSGELEQSADTIILINDPNKNSTSDTKVINLLIPKCRSGKRNVFINIRYLKAKQRMEDMYNEH